MSETVINSIKLKNTYTKWKLVIKHKQLYIMLSLPLVYFLIFHYVPMCGIVIAFQDYKPIHGIKGIFTGEWIGIEHFMDFFTNPYFSRVFTNTIIISSLRLIFGFPVPIILAILINEIRSNSYKRVVQTISYLPHFLSWVIVSSILSIILSPSSGFVNQAMGLVGIDPINFLGSPYHFRGVLVLSGIWKEAGWGSILYLAAISGIDESMYEASELDGASRWQKALYITFPGMLPVISINLILSVGNILNAGFEQIFLTYSPSVYGVADIIDTYVYREGLINLNYSFSTAVGLSKSLIALVLIIITNKITRKIEAGGLW